MDAEMHADDSGAKRKLCFNLNLPNNVARNEATSSDNDDASKDRSPSPSLLTDDFLTIVPKPTLLSKEKAKKRLQAFGLSKFSSYVNSKKQRLAEPKEKEETATTEDDNTTMADAQRAVAENAIKRTPKKATSHIDAARETVEAIEKCKLEETNFRQIVKHESDKLAKSNYMDRKRRRRSSSRDWAKREHRERRSESGRDAEMRTRSRSVERRSRDRKTSPLRNEKRSSFSRERHSHERRLSVPRLYGRYREKRETWSDYEDDFSENPVTNECASGIVDIRRMLLFNSACYNFWPYQYTKIDGSMAEISAQYIRFTVKSTPRIEYCPNPATIAGTYFQRNETFSIIPKPQKDCLMNLISQAERAKPLTPHKPSSTRNWYTRNYLLEHQPQLEDFSDVSDAMDAMNDEEEPKRSKRGKSKKRKSKKKDDKDEKGKRHRHKRDESQKRKESRRDKKNRRSSVASDRNRDAEEKGVSGKRERKRTESQKSDSNSNNSNIDDKSQNNHLSSSSRFCQESNQMQLEQAIIERRPKTENPSHDKKAGGPPKPPPTSDSSYKSKSGQKSKSKAGPMAHGHNEHVKNKHASIVKQEHVDKQADLVKDWKNVEEVKDKHYVHVNCKSVISTRLRRLSEMEHKSYSKKAANVLPPPATPLSATKIYNIETDCVDSKGKLSNDIKIKEKLREKAEVRKTEVKLDHLTEELHQTVADAIDNKHKLLDQFEPIESGDKRHLKEIHIEKLKTKPSELYSPTLQSSTSNSSTSNNDMPDTNEYRSHWESEEEYSAPQSVKSVNNSWESEDEEYPATRPAEERVIDKPKELTERSLEMPLNINISRPRSQIILPKETPEIKPLLLFEDFDGTNASWDADMKQQVSSFEVNPDIDSYSKHDDYDTLPMIDKPNLEDEYMQFMSSVTTIEDTTQRKRNDSSSSSSTSSSSSSSSSDTSSSSNEEHNEQKEENLVNDKVDADRSSQIDAENENSPICKVDSTSSPAILIQDENKLDLSPRKALAAIILAKKNPLVGCSLFKDEDSDNEDTQGPTTDSHKSKTTSDTPIHDDPKPQNEVLQTESRRQSSPLRKRLDVSPKRSRGNSPPQRYPSIKRYSPKRDRRRSPPRRRDNSPRRKDGSPRKDTSPRCASTPRNKDSRDGSLKMDSPRRMSSPKHRDFSPKRRDIDRKQSPRHYGRDISPSPRRRSPKHKDSSRDVSPRHDLRHRSPKHRDRSPRPNIDLPRLRDYDRDRHRDGDLLRSRDDRYRDRKYRDGSPRYRDSPTRYSPSRRRTPPRHRYSPKRDRSPRYRDRSPRRRSNSPPCRVYSRSRSKERKHESITQALHRLAGMDYDPPKSPMVINSPMDGYIRGVADSTISDEQLMQNRSIGGGDFNSTQSPVYFNQPYKLNNDGTSSSPKRIPLDDRINQVLGIDAPKPINSNYQTDQAQYYNQMYYDQYGVNMPNNDYDHGNYKHYNRHLVAVNTVSSKVLQVGNVLQVVPTEQQQQIVIGHKKKDEKLIDPTLLQVGSCQKFVPVGNMLQIVPTTELPIDNTAQIAADLIAKNKKRAEDLLLIKNSERKAERDKRRVDRERRRKEKELKRKEREKCKLMKIKMKSEEMIKKALMLDVCDEVDDDYKLPTVSFVSTSTTRISKGILVVRDKNQKREDVHIHKQKKGVKFADGVLPGEGTSPSAGEELSSPPPFSKIPKEKRYTKTKKPKKSKQFKKKIKVKIIRKSKKRDEDDDNLPPPSPPPGSPPPHVYPPRVKPMYANYYQSYQFNAVNCRPMSEAPLHPFPTLPNMQYSIQPHLAQAIPVQAHLGQPVPIPSHLTATPHLAIAHLAQPAPTIAAMHVASLHLHVPRLTPKSHKPVDKGL